MPPYLVTALLGVVKSEKFGFGLELYVIEGCLAQLA